MKSSAENTVFSPPGRAAPSIKPMKYLIVNADDFGLAPEVNAAVSLAHSRGILTSTSLMINEEAAGDAVSIARENPRLGVGIHVSLVMGKAASPPSEIAPIVDAGGNFDPSPVTAGLRFFFLKKCKAALRKEIEAQMEKFLESGIFPTHVDGHLNIHLHPTVLSALLPLMDRYGIKAMRVPNESLVLHLSIDSSNAFLKAVYAVIFKVLGKRARRRLRDHPIAFPKQTFGLLQSGNMTKGFVKRAIPHLENGFTEMSFHIATSPLPDGVGAPNYHYVEELQTLIDPELKKLLKEQNIQLANYDTLRKIEG